MADFLFAERSPAGGWTGEIRKPCEHSPSLRGESTRCTDPVRIESVIAFSPPLRKRRSLSRAPFASERIQMALLLKCEQGTHGYALISFIGDYERTIGLIATHPEHIVARERERSDWLKQPADIVA